MKSIKRRSLLIAAGGAMVVMAVAFTIQRRPPAAGRPPLGGWYHLDTAANTKGYIEVSFTLASNPRVTKAWFDDAHSLIPSIGENRYTYNGDILFDRRRARIACDWFEPRLLLRIGDDYFLLAKDYFRTAGGFVWYRMSNEEQFVQMQAAELDERFWSIALTEPRQTYYYRVWLLDTLASTVPPARVRQCFDALLAIDRRFAYDEAWGNRELGRASDLQSFLRWVSDGKVAELWEPLLVLLDVARPGDDPQIIGIAAGALYAIDPGRAKPLLCEYLRRWRAEGVRGDMRRFAMREMMLYYAKFQCDDAGATSQSTGPTTQGG